MFHIILYALCLLIALLHSLLLHRVYAAAGENSPFEIRRNYYGRDEAVEDIVDGAFWGYLVFSLVPLIALEVIYWVLRWLLV